MAGFNNFDFEAFCGTDGDGFVVGLFFPAEAFEGKYGARGRLLMQLAFV